MVASTHGPEHVKEVEMVCGGIGLHTDELRSETQDIIDGSTPEVGLVRAGRPSTAFM